MTTMLASVFTLSCFKGGVIFFTLPFACMFLHDLFLFLSIWGFRGGMFPPCCPRGGFRTSWHVMGNGLGTGLAQDT